ncbi:MAG: Uma2 family endonuclease [Cyanobacteria bacterium P01_D01_bin.73]
MAGTLTRTYTVDEYRDREETAEQRHEYCDGEIFAMTGGSRSHNKIAANLLRLLDLNESYEVYLLDMRLWLPAVQRGTYPDLMVVSGEPRLTPGREDEILNPCLIVEVLSKSTADYDRGDKFRYYASNPELKEYILVDQYQPVVEQYVRAGEANADKWLLQRHTGLEKVLKLEAIALELQLQSIYRGIVFG